MNEIRLAITTIGDLLFNKKISRAMNNKPIENVNLFIPDYQRPYKWTARNAIQLLDDITDAKNLNKEIYRVGTLILHESIEMDDKGKKITKYNIVDGQQRTITFSLLLYALYENEREQERKQIDFLAQQVFDNEYTKFNIPNNLDAFRRRVSKRNEEEDSNIDFNRFISSP